MTLKQTVYFMALVGAIAGLCSWLIQSWVADYWTGQSYWVDVIAMAVLGALIGGLTVGFSDHWTTDRVVPKWVIVGVLLGLVAGACGSIVVYLGGTLEAHPQLGRPLEWIICGGLIGFVTGLRWFGANRLRAVHALLGGLVGGAIAGVLYQFLPATPQVYSAVSYMLLGMGITLGVSLAPVLLRDGVLLFISSADPRAQNKYGSPQQEWVLQEGDKLVLGSQGSERNMTMYGRPVDIYVPDAMVAKRHAVLIATGRRFFIQQHSENVGAQGQPLAVLQQNHVNVLGTRELHNGDEIVVGQTLLKFVSRKQAPNPVSPMGRGR